MTQTGKETISENSANKSNKSFKSYRGRAVKDGSSSAEGRDGRNMIESPDNYSRNLKKTYVVTTHHATEKKTSYITGKHSVLDKDNN